MATPSHDVIHYLCSLVHHQSDAAESDRELLRRFVERRDDHAFAALLRRHGPMVFNLARRITGDKQLAEDVFQATFLMLSQKGRSIRRPKALPCWLHGVARRLAVHARSGYLRRQRQEARCRLSSPLSPLDELTAQEFLAVLDEELGKLPEKYRAPLILCCLEGLSQEETSKRLGCSAGAVKGRLERGRQRLRMRLERRGLTLPAVLGGTLLLAGATGPVPAALAQATLQTATTGSNPAQAVAALIEEAIRMTFVSKLKVFAVVVTLFALAGTGVSMIALLPQAMKEHAPPTVSDDKSLSAAKRVDRYGDSLPEGAMMRLGTLQRRAVGAQVAVTADGKSIVTVRAGMYVHIWDAATGKLREKRQLPGDFASEAVLSSDGRWLLTGLSAGEDRLSLWDLQTGKRVRTLSIEGATNIWPAAFSADGKAIAATGFAGKGHCTRVWELATGKVIFAKEIRQSKGISRVLFAPDGERLLTIINGEPSTLICWDLAKGRQLWSVDNFSPYAMICTPDGKLLSSDNAPHLDLATGQLLPREKIPPTGDESVLRLALSPDGRTLFVSTFKKVIVWDRAHGKVLRTLAGGGEQFSVWPDGKSILTNNAALQRWDVASGKPLYADTFGLGHVGEVRRLAWSADGRRLASDATDGTLRVWDAVTGRPLHFQHDRKTFRMVSANTATETGDNVVDLSPDGHFLLTNAVGEECLKMWEAETGKEIRSLMFPAREPKEGVRQLFRARISSDGARVIALLGSQSNFHIVGEAQAAHKIVVWDVKTGDRLICHAIGWTEPDGSAIAPDGGTLVSSGALRDVVSGKEMARLEGMGQYSTRVYVAFSHDGALVVGESRREALKNKVIHLSADGVRVWETATGKSVAHLKTKPWVEEVAFHPNNRFLATNDRDGIQIWDTLTGRVVRRLRMPENIPATPMLGSFASCPTFAADGRLATGHPDSTILLWEVPLPARKSEAFTPRELDVLWTDLADADAAKAWRAVWRLADAPHDALALLRGRVKPSPTAAADVTRKLLDDLDSNSFAVREAAAKRLRELGLQVESALRAELKAKPSLEQRRRIEELLAALQGEPSPPTTEELRQLRALIVLERIGTPEARRLLEEVAKGPESARLTRQARAALMCLR